MKARFFLTLLAVSVVVLAGCASTKKATDTVVGTWNYTVYDTPEGDAKGDIVITSAGDRLDGQISSILLGQTVPFKALRVEGDRIHFSAEFDVYGQPMPASGVLTRDGERIEGTVDVEGYGTYRLDGSRASS